MTVAELIKELKQLDLNERIIVSVKEPASENRPEILLERYYKGNIEDIAYHMDNHGNNAYALEVENSFIEYVRK